MSATRTLMIAILSAESDTEPALQDVSMALVVVGTIAGAGRRRDGEPAQLAFNGTTELVLRDAETGRTERVATPAERLTGTAFMRRVARAYVLLHGLEAGGAAQ